MPPVSSIPVFLVATEHVYIMVLECFLWTSPRARKAFNLTPAFAESTKALAANQGLYNGFLAAGLFWGLAHPVRDFGKQIQLRRWVELRRIRRSILFRVCRECLGLLLFYYLKHY